MRDFEGLCRRMHIEFYGAFLLAEVCGCVILEVKNISKIYFLTVLNLQSVNELKFCY